MLMILINDDISRAIKIIELVDAPTQIIIRGPNATFGNEFKTVKYGSTTSYRKLFHHRIDATINPKTEATVKLNNVS